MLTETCIWQKFISVSLLYKVKNRPNGKCFIHDAAIWIFVYFRWGTSVMAYLNASQVELRYGCVNFNGYHHSLSPFSLLSDSICGGKKKVMSYRVVTDEGFLCWQFQNFTKWQIMCIIKWVSYLQVKWNNRQPMWQFTGEKVCCNDNKRNFLTLNVYYYYSFVRGWW